MLSVSMAALAAMQNTSRAQEIWLDAVTIIATKTIERASETLAAVSTIRGEQLKQTNPNSPGRIFDGVPGVWTQERADDPSTAINIRGLQDFGRVAVTIDGARQNFQRTGHAANGQVYIEPETIGGVDVVRGPTANIYGSGAIGGVVSFRTKDAEDILRPGERYATEIFGLGSTNVGGVGSFFQAFRMGQNAEFFYGGTFRDMSSYKDAHTDLVPNTGNETWTGMAKATFRPADGHQLKLGYTHLNSEFTTGQPFNTAFGPPPNPTLQVTPILDTQIVNQNATARWTYMRPEDRVWNFDFNVYWTRTKTDQVKVSGLTPASPPPANAFAIGNIGDRRNFQIETVGFDFNNTSRFDTGGWRNAFTWGVDGFRDKVYTEGFGVVFTPRGERTVSGGFAQMKSNYSNWLEVISAVRFDQYQLEGGNTTAEGSRLSPKITVGVTPVKGFQPYVTYAEGYRAPATTETLQAGIHPVNPQFTFLPNASLKPEVGKNKELGVNLTYNDVYRTGDAFRGKFNIYRNDVDDFIELTTVAFSPLPGALCAAPPFCVQYQNINHARLDGAEFDLNYDAGSWFTGFGGSYVHGNNQANGKPLANIPPWFLTTTWGIRSPDRKFTAAVRWQYVADKTQDDIPVDGQGFRVYAPTDHYNLVNLYLTYQITPDALAALSIENLLNQQYTRYTTSFGNPLGQGTPLPFFDPGLTVKASYRVRFAG